MSPTSSAPSLLFPFRQNEMPLASMFRALQELKERPNDLHEIAPSRLLVTKIVHRRMKDQNAHESLLVYFQFDGAAKNKYLVRTRCPPSGPAHAVTESVTVCAKFKQLKTEGDHSRLRSLSFSTRTSSLTLLEFATMAFVISQDISVSNDVYERRSARFSSALFDGIHKKFGGEMKCKRGKGRPVVTSVLSLEKLLEAFECEWQNVLDDTAKRMSEVSHIWFFEHHGCGSIVIGPNTA
jgi:hypothetical protein